MKALIVTAASGVLLLSACGKGQDNGTPMSADDVAKKVQAVKLTPGQWETTVQILDVKMEGLPEGAPTGMMNNMIGTKTTVKSCISREQAEKPNADFLAAQKNANCSYSSFDMTGGLIKAAMTCKGKNQPGELKMNMTGKYGADSYEMNQETNMSGFQKGMSMAMKSKVTGRHIGNCPPGSEGAAAGGV
ncbi:DUF3617 domain-containing protein [Rhizorhapis suberifaciens]|uniref:DUF3617 domain-containing protein n=1 Tax=Rhizorhapis suberifaciens TaxID=13656 RepID=A0A840HTB2_9SPHN|nr:DUF3617 domain-containing protein [Rhizorhapis suberifaciens]MBB4640941.1 hypothetical protein [Rhizorhapis suberifaciens]